MGNVQILTTLASPTKSAGQVANDIDTLTDVLSGLVQTYIPGLPPLKGIRPFAVEDNDRAPIPCCMIQPISVTKSMITSARFENWYTFDFWYAVGGGDPGEVSVLVTDGGALFSKLFSNNALNDRGAANSNQFATYSTNWGFSKMTAIQFSSALLTGRTNGPKYFALGKFKLSLQTVPALA